MKLRSIFLSSAFLIALTSTLGFKPEKRMVLPADWIYVQNGVSTCMKDFGEYTDQSNCSALNTGPVCTVTPGALSTRTAYATGSIVGCTIPWRQP
jgi:hypothetical protein